MKSISMKPLGTAAMAVLFVVFLFYAAFGTPEVYANGMFTYTVTDGNATITGYTGEATDVVIPENIDGYPVTAIGVKAFFWRTELTSIDLPETLTSIGESAFDGCTGLSAITIPENVTSLESYAFANCKNVTELRYNVKAELSFGSDKYAASRQVFSGIGIDANGVTVTFGKHVSKVPNYIFCPIAGESYNVQTVLFDGNITAIGRNAFFHCYSLKHFGKENTIAIPDTVEVIGEAAFDTCTGVTRIEIPASVKQIDTLAFTLCKNVTELYFDAGEIKAFGGDKYAASRQVFASIGLDTSGTTVIFGKHVTKIPDYMFRPIIGETYNVQTVLFEGEITEIGSNAFYHCDSLKHFGKEYTIAIPDTVEVIGEAAFDTCTGVTRIEIPASVKQIDTLAFTLCKNVTELYYDASMISSFGADKYASNRQVFANIGMDTDGTTAVFGEHVTKIPDYMFLSVYGEAFNIKTVILHGTALTSIGRDAFLSADRLEKAIYCGSKEQFEQTVSVGEGNNRLITALGYHDEHIWGNVYHSVPADCMHDGLQLRDCTYCGLTDRLVTPALGHGFIDGKCTVCGEQLTPGDCNGDGTVNGKDVTYLLGYLANYDEESGESNCVLASADANGDGTVNGKDVVRLLRYLAEYDEETGTSSVVLGSQTY